MNEKLSVLVRVDLECAQAQVAARGHVTVHNIQALYVVVKRANALLAHQKAQLAEQAARLGALDEAKNQFFANASHLARLLKESNYPAS